MAVIWESITYVYAFLAVIPVVPFAVIYFIYLMYNPDKKKAFRLAMDITTALLIGCVAMLFNEIFSSRFGFYGILLLILISAGLLGNLQYRIKGTLNIKRIGRAIWRLGFFVMSVLYLLLMCIRIGQNLWSA
jgi:hypothetical protein